MTSSFKVMKKLPSLKKEFTTKEDFERYVGYSVKEQTLGYLLKNHGMKKSKSNGITWYRGYVLATASSNQSTL